MNFKPLRRVHAFVLAVEDCGSTARNSLANHEQSKRTFRSLEFGIFFMPLYCLIRKDQVCALAQFVSPQQHTDDFLLSERIHIFRGGESSNDDGLTFGHQNIIGIASMNFGG